MIHRFDFISIFTENTAPEHLREYAKQRVEIAQKYTEGVFDDYDIFPRKYSMYAKALTLPCRMRSERFYMSIG